MAINSYNEFLDEYEKPSLDGLIVGFSGIDPQKKKQSGNCGCDNSNLSDEQKNIVNQLIDARIGNLDDGCECDPNNLIEQQREIVDNQILSQISRLEVRIDGGNVDPDAEDPYILPGTINVEDINHEKLANLLGGGSDGHFHLSKSEREKLISYPSYSDLTLSISQNIQHEGLLGLLGGDTNGHFHLTQTERAKLQAYPDFVNLPGLIADNINHENLTNLLGGGSGGHYHLTQAERQKLAQIINALFVNGGDTISIPSDVENKLTRETWTFELEDGSSYSREIALWI